MENEDLKIDAQQDNAPEVVEHNEDKTTYVLTVNAQQAEDTLDRLLEKAGRLKGLMDEIAGDGKVRPPQIVYTVSLGNVTDLANAPAECFTPEFLALLQRDLPLMLVARPKAPAPVQTPKKKGKIITIGEA